MASTVTEKELIKKVPGVIRRREQERLLGTGLPTIRESPLRSTVDRIKPESVLSKRRIKTYPPSYSNQDGRKEVIGQKQAQDAIRAIRSGVPIVIPKINPTWVKLQKHAQEENVGQKYRNEGITSARFGTAPGRATRGGRRGVKRKRRKTRKRRKKPKTRRRKKIRKKRKRRKTRKRKRRRRGGVAAGFLGEQSCGEVRQHPMFDDCCGLDKAEIEAEKAEIEAEKAEIEAEKAEIEAEKDVIEIVRNQCIERLRAERERREAEQQPEEPDNRQQQPEKPDAALFHPF